MDMSTTTTVGVTIPANKSMFTCGIWFNTLLWYDFMTACGYDTWLICDKPTNYGEKYKSTVTADKKEFQVILAIGLYMPDYFTEMKKREQNL